MICAKVVGAKSEEISHSKVGVEVRFKCGGSSCFVYTCQRD